MRYTYVAGMLSGAVCAYLAYGLINSETESEAISYPDFWVGYSNEALSHKAIDIVSHEESLASMDKQSFEKLWEVRKAYESQMKQEGSLRHLSYARLKYDEPAK